jgi:polynucleotide 5'-kinase involved in rRNA processing
MPNNIYCPKCHGRVILVASQGECRCQNPDCAHVQRVRVVSAGELRRLLAPLREQRAEVSR